MLDSFLKVACQISPPKQKIAFHSSNDHDWLEKFVGTPLLEQAVTLEQSDIQNEIAEKSQNSQQSEQQRSFWNNRDQIQLQKRMLELQLVQMQAGVNAGPPMTEPVTGPDAATMPPDAGGEVAGTPETSMQASDAKVASVLQAGDSIGRLMAKHALSMGGLGELGTKALEMAAKNPRAAAALGTGAAGAAYGAATGEGAGNRLGRAVGFGAGGAALGAGAAQAGIMGKDINRVMKASPGMGLGEAVRDVGGQHYQGALSGARGALGKVQSHVGAAEKRIAGIQAGHATGVAPLPRPVAPPTRMPAPTGLRAPEVVNFE